MSYSEAAEEEDGGAADWNIKAVTTSTTVIIRVVGRKKGLQPRAQGRWAKAGRRAQTQGRALY
jgi:hypothetical protein